MHRYVIIVAGGKGLRMGGEVPKQFLPVGGRPVLMRTLDAFHTCDPQVRLVLVLPASQQDYWKQLCREYAFDLPYTLTEGGETRFHSVKSGLAAIPADEEEALVAVHDGVRPFVSAEVIARCYEKAAETEAVVPVTDVVETVRHLTDEGASVTVDRNAYKLVQTPQAFSLKLLRRAYAQPYVPAFTDDASVVEALGHPVTLVQGNRENIKITTPFDLIVAEALTRGSDEFTSKKKKSEIRNQK